MKSFYKFALAAAAAMTLASVSIGGVQAAEVAQKSNTATADVTFKANDSETKPVDPTDPSKPLDPNKPTDPADPSNPGTGNAGPLSIDYVSNIHFGTQKIQDTPYSVTNENAHIQVTDKRGTGAGWQASAAISDFKGTKDGKDVTLNGAQLALNNGGITTTPNNAATAPTTEKAITLGAKNTPVMTAAAGTGQGTWIDLFAKPSDITLTVPAGNIVSDVQYNATITWTLGDTPQG